MICQNCILRVNGKLLKTFFLKKKSFLDIERFFSAFCWFFSKGCQYNILRVHLNIFQNKHFDDLNFWKKIILMKTVFFWNKQFDELFSRKKNISIIFGHSAVNFRPFVQKQFVWVVKTAFYLSMRNFRTNLCFEENFILFEHWRKFFRRYVERLLVVLSKLHPTCRQNILGKSKLFEK